MKKKILVLTSTFPRWKNDTTPPFVYELEKRLTKDFEIHLLAPHYQGAKKEEMMDGLHVHRFQYFWPAKLQKLCYEGGVLPSLKYNKFLYIQAITFIFFELIATIKLCRKYKFDLIHAHWIIPQGIIAYLINKLIKIPYIVTSHGSDLHSLRLNHIKKLILGKAKKIIVVSNYLKEQIKKLGPSFLSKTEVLPMGVDTKLFNPNKYDQSIKEKYNITGSFLLFVGRLASEKGLSYLIEAMTLVIKKLPKTKLMIIGSGPLETKLKNQVDKLRLSSSIIFIGAITKDKLPKYYATADIFISPSIKEGFGITFLEATVSGCHVLGTHVGGISDIVEPSNLIKPKRASLISKKLISMLENKKIMKNNFVSFDWKVISKKYTDLLIDVTQQSSFV